MRIFKKSCKNRFSVEGSAPEPPFASCGWGLRLDTPALLLPPAITILPSSFHVLNASNYPLKRTNNYSKCSIFASSSLLHLFFTSNSVVLLTGGARIFFAPERRVS